MRRLAPLLLICCLLWLPTGCKKKRSRVPPKMTDDGMLASMVHVSDPRLSVQLIRGFYAIEGDAWRWTARSFAVTLRPPLNAAQNGCRLVLKFTVPDVVAQKLHSVKLFAKVNGLDLPPEEYNLPGEQTYSRDVPAAALTGDAVPVDFVLDKFLPPTPADERELGVIVSAVGFEAK